MFDGVSVSTWGVIENPQDHADQQLLANKITTMKMRSDHLENFWDTDKSNGFVTISVSVITYICV